jgi:hypothetical protein
MVAVVGVWFSCVLVFFPSEMSCLSIVECSFMCKVVGSGNLVRMSDAIGSFRV